MSMIPLPNDDLINEIGEHLGFKMWNKRDKTLTYEYAGNRDGDGELADDYFVGSVIQYNNLPLLVFQRKGIFAYQSEYTLNLITLRPTKASENQTLLPRELINKIKRSRDAVFIHNK